MSKLLTISTKMFGILVLSIVTFSSRNDQKQNVEDLSGDSSNESSDRSEADFAQLLKSTDTDRFQREHFELAGTSFEIR